MRASGKQTDLNAANRPRARFVGGTLVLEGVPRALRPPDPFEWINARWRCPAVYYRALYAWFRQQGIRNSIPRWQKLSLSLHDRRELHAYQSEALHAWLAAERWGSVVLPTGAGKTLLALQAIAQTQASTLVVVPTLDLLHQWYACLEDAFEMPIGVWYGEEKRLGPVTVTTYPSAWAQAEVLGNQFKLLVFDEIHHLPAPSWHEIALMCASPYRLGLTATYPEGRPEWGRWEGRPSGSYAGTLGDPASLLDELVGPVVYRKHIDDLTGDQLAEYRTLRIRVDLTQEEQVAYDAAYATYTGYVREARLREQYGPGWWNAFTVRSAYEAPARRAKVAELKLKGIVHEARAKLEVLDQLLREHREQQMLIFTAHNRLAYRISRQHLVPVITHQTKTAERKAILEGFRAGTYHAIVTTNVLNEGVDVPEAKVAVILGGSASAREYAQRLGRVLRKRGNAQAILYEVIARNTVDERIAQRRKAR
jgi:superfamily II DNA or RNA helicase